MRRKKKEKDPAFKDAAGKIHEILVQHHLYGRTDDDALYPVENVLDFFRYKNILPHEEYLLSRKMANDCTEYVLENGLIDFPIEHISRNLKKSKEEEHCNATDLLINGRVGLSLKALRRNAKPTVGNIGFGVLEEITKFNPLSIYNLGKKKFFDKYPELAKLSSLKKLRMEFQK